MGPWRPGRAGGCRTGQPGRPVAGRCPQNVRGAALVDSEGIMNRAPVTAFLPKFVGFPSLRGLHSSTVQPRRAPAPGRRAPVRGAAAHTAGRGWTRGRPDGRPKSRPGSASCPIRCEGPASVGPVGPADGRGRSFARDARGQRFEASASRGAAGREGAAPRAAPPLFPDTTTRGPSQVRAPRAVVAAPVLPSGRCRRPRSAASAAAATASAAGRPASAGRAPAAGASSVVAVSPARPPARVTAVAGRPAARPRTRRTAGAAPAGERHQRPDEQDRDHRQDDADEHGVTLLPFPPKRPPVGASLLRDREMPVAHARQSRVEELQSFGAGWPA